MAGIFRTDSLPSRYAWIDKRRYLWFSGTDYLGMAHHPALLNAIQDGLKTWGTHFGSSRNNTLQLTIYRKAEEALAEFTGAKDALLVSSGMLAAGIVRTHLRSALLAIEPKLFVTEVEAPMLHPALRRGLPAATPWSEWASQTVESTLKNDPAERTVIYSDAVGSPQTTRFDFSVFSHNPNLFLVVDDSHGLGVTGKNGTGAYRQLPHAATENQLVVASLNKALGVPGGVVLGSDTVLDQIRRTPTYAGASPFPPVYAHALVEMIRQCVYQQAQERMLRNVRYFESLLGKEKKRFQHIPDYPAYTTDDPGLFPFLADRGILTSCFPYPAPHDPLLTRIVLSAVHESGDIEWLASVCRDYFAGSRFLR